MDYIERTVTNHVRGFGNPLCANQLAYLTHIVDPCQVELYTLVDRYLLAKETIVNLAEQQ